MRLQSLEVVPVAVPLARQTHVTADWKLEGLLAAVVQLLASDGTRGIGYAPLFNRRYLPPLVAMIKGLFDLIRDQDPSQIEAHWRRMQRDVSSVSLQGLGQMAIAALDMALWDLEGKRQGLPVYRLLGGVRDRVPVYASTYFVGLSRPEECVQKARELAAQGFRAMKIGGLRPQTPAGDVERLRAVREAVGPEMRLMMDCFQAWSPPEAIRLGRELEPCRLTWLEDPVSPDDLAGCTEVARALDTPVATGEWYYSLSTFEEIVQRRAADILILDLARVGGFTGWRRIAAYAEAHQMPVANHLLSEVSLHALAASPTGMVLEYCPWSFPLFRGVPPLDQQGELPVPSGPGLGLELDPAALKRYRVE